MERNDVMIEVYRKLFGLLDAHERKRFVLLALVMVAVSMSELVGISSVLLLLSVLSDPARIDDSALLSGVRDMLGIRDPSDFKAVLAVGVGIVVCVGLVVKASGVYAILRYSQNCGAAISSRLLDAYLRFPYDWYLTRNTADLANKVLGEADRMVAQVLEPALRLLSNMLVALAIIGLLLAIDPVVALAAAGVLGGAYMLVYAVLRHRLQMLGEAVKQTNQARFRIASEASGGLKELKLLALEDSYVNRFADRARARANHQSKIKAMSQLPRYALEGIAFAAMIVLVFVLMARTGGDLVGAIAVIGTFAFASLRLLPALQQIYQTLSLIRNGRPLLDGLHADYREAMAETASRPAPAQKNRLPLAREVVLDQVHYAYPGSERPGLDGVSLSIPARSTIGLVGGTGAGKTTLVDVMLGLLIPDSGSVSVDGCPLRPETLRAWQQNVGYVPQAIYLIDASVAENVAFGLPRDQIDMAAVERAARIAALHDFVSEELPDGYDTMVGERGVRLSGGQRQRIGIARALYNDPALLIMDEATSALDTLTEKLVMDAVQRVRRDKTVILIAHRLSTVRQCDRIYLMERGRVVVSGNFEELVASNASFRKMATAG